MRFRDQRFVFAVGRCDDSEFPGQFESLIEFAIVDAEGAFVGQENFERLDAGSDDFAELFRGILVESRDAHVK